MEFVKYIILGISILFTISWCYNLRHKAKYAQSSEKSMELFGFLMTVSIIVIISCKLSPFHLLWMLPSSFLIGLLSIGTPLNLLWFFSSLYFSIWYIGVSNAGRKFYVNGEYERAVAEFTKEIKNNPASAESYFNLALAYGKLGQHKAEISALEKAVELMPTKPELHYNLGTAYKDYGENQKAIESFKKAIELKPDYVKAHYFIGKTYAEIDDKASAEKEYNTLIGLDIEVARKLKEIINQN